MLGKAGKILTLNSGLKIPQMALGTFMITGEECKNIIKKAILEEGYRHIDTAKVYNNEEMIGEALKEVLATGNITREELFITTKLWATDKHPGKVLPACKESLRKLQLEYIDLYLIHAPTGEYDRVNKSMIQVPLHVTWPEMEELVHMGIAKSIGVSNFNVQLLLDLFSYAKIPPSVNQVELHPYITQCDLVDWCTKMGMVIEAYAPLGAPAMVESMPHAKYFKDDPLIIQLATKYNRSWGEIVLNWGAHRGYVIVAKTLNPGRLKTNLLAGGFDMEDEEYILISKLNVNYRVYDTRLREVQCYYPIFA